VKEGYEAEKRKEASGKGVLKKGRRKGDVTFYLISRGAQRGGAARKKKTISTALHKRD